MFEDEEFNEPLVHKETEEQVKGNIKVTVEIHPEDITYMLTKQIVDSTAAKLNENIRRIVTQSLETYTSDKGVSGEVRAAIRDHVSKILTEKHPDLVENKVNEFVEAVKTMKFDGDGYTRRNNDVLTKQGIQDLAREKVENYIKGELVESVKMTKAEVETFAKNYFTNSLFKAMDIMNRNAVLEQAK